jgi:hypothetical protein
MYAHMNKRIKKKDQKTCWGPVVHACDPSYSGDGNREDHGSIPAQECKLVQPLWKKFGGFLKI